MTPPPSFRQLIGVPPSTVSITNKSTALVVIDAQNTYDGKTGSPLGITSGLEQSQKVIGDLANRFRKADAPIFWIQHTAGSGAPVFNPDNATFDFIGDVRPEKVGGGSKEFVVVKTAPSSFTKTDLEDQLKANDIKQVVLTGYMAHVCVTGTARSAFELGYDVVIVRDGVGDRDIPASDGSGGTVKGEEVVRVVLDELGDAIGTVVKSEDIKD
ncbi:Isochorismatase hydrolase [Meredithblackwellia eburnea MCA 4105]